jgi:hypothetical protein
MAMVITLHTPAAKSSRLGLSPWSIFSRHYTVFLVSFRSAPTGVGKHAVTAKPIDPLAPAFNPKAFTEERRVEKWFRRNCKDVAQRECTPGEKADVLAWLQTLR